MTAYLDTHVLVWLLEGKFKKLSSSARDILDTGALLISPMVLLELEYLYEVGRTELNSSDVQLQFTQDLGISVCALPLPRIVNAAISEKWTRDAFDRLIVAHAKANDYAALITADEKIRKHYSRALW